MLLRFAVELLNDVADECERRATSLSVGLDKENLLANAADEITNIVEILVEPDNE